MPDKMYGKTSKQVPTSSFSIQKTGKGKLPRLPFHRIKEKVLGRTYELSLVLVGPSRIRTLNRIYRRKDKATDILSFPLTKNSGEIFICLNQVKSRAKKISGNANNHVAFLFIHGLLHLKGLDHGSRMEREEKAILQYFKCQKK
ncbi:MAG: rRNA maturation RNase YbeY [Patescibacteria group bacterium]